MGRDSAISDYILDGLQVGLIRSRKVHSEVPTKTHLEIRSRTCRQALFDLSCFEKLVLIDQSAQFANDGDVFADVPRKLAELWVLFDKFLHIGYRVNRLSFGGTRLVRLYVCLERSTKVAKGRQMMALKERIRCGRERDFLCGMT